MSATFDASFTRYQVEGAVAIDRVSKALSFVLWTATATKLLLHGYRREALLALSCSLTALLWGACSWARRRFYVRHARWLTAAVLLQAHAVASAVCLAGYALTSGARRHSDNALRFAWIMAINNTGIFQALAALSSWPLMGMRWLLPVQLASVALMAGRLQGMCRIALARDEGAPRLFAAATWLLRQMFSVVDAGPLWARSSRALQEVECLQVNLWWLCCCSAAAAYASWMREQRARERYARRLGRAGAAELRRMLERHPMYSHRRPALLVAVELYAMAAILWEALCTLLPLLLRDVAPPAGGSGLAPGLGGTLARPPPRHGGEL